MRNNLFRDAALLVAAVLLTTAFWSCSKNEEPEPTPPVVSVTGVTLDKSSISILVGASETLAATVSPKDAANKKVMWKSDKPEIATVDANGKVTGVKSGQATITVTTEDGGKTATCKVTVSDKEIKVTGVKLNKSETSILVGGNETLTATVLPEDATNQKVTWKSDKPEIASVDANGKVTGVKAGEAIITVTTEDGGKTATCKVTVSDTEIKVTGVTLNKTALTLNIGANETLTATVAPADATNKKVTWKSSDAAVASVDANGKVTGVAAGEATITVTTEDGGKTAFCRVTVSDKEVKVTGITLAALAIYVGESKAVTATVKPDDATNKALTWTSSDETVATVDATGKVTGKKIGTATITATAQDGSGVSGSCTVTVLSPVKKVTVEPANLTLGQNNSYTLKATVEVFGSGTDTGVTWTSSDTTIATVDATGKVTATDKVGTVTITATSKADPAKKGTCTVTVLFPVKKVTVEPANLTLGQNKSYTLKATVEVFGSGTDTGVTWTSSDTTIATVDAAGKVTTTDKVGTVTITATSKADPAKKGTCTIKVSGDQTDIGYGEYGPEEEW